MGWHLRSDEPTRHVPLARACRALARTKAASSLDHHICAGSFPACGAEAKPAVGREPRHPAGEWVVSGGCCPEKQCRRRHRPKPDPGFDPEVVSTACPQGDARDLGAGAGHVLEVHRGGGRRRGRAERERSCLEGAQQHRPAARHRVRDGAGGFAGPRRRLANFGSKMGIDATRKWPEEGSTRPWPGVQAMSGDCSGAGGRIGRAGAIPAESLR